MRRWILALIVASVVVAPVSAMKKPNNDNDGSNNIQRRSLRFSYASMADDGKTGKGKGSSSGGGKGKDGSSGESKGKGKSSSGSKGKGKGSSGNESQVR